MARYHFNVENGQRYPDIKGGEFPDLESVRNEAVRVADFYVTIIRHRFGMGRRGDWLSPTPMG